MIRIPHTAEEKAKRLTAIGEEITPMLRKADTFIVGINILLAEAKAICDAMHFGPVSFSDFKKRWCPGLGKSQAYKRLAIASGKTTEQAERTKETERKRKQRARVPENNSGTAEVATPPFPKLMADGPTSMPGKAELVRTAGGTPMDTSGFGERAQQQLATIAETTLSGSPAPNPGTSPWSLAQHKQATRDYFKNMNPDDLREAVRYTVEVRNKMTVGEVSTEQRKADNERAYS